MSLPLFAGRLVELVTVAGQPTGPEDEWQATVQRFSGVAARCRRIACGSAA